ncbi:hypothetical protein BJ742DRAFT_345481 [Cladochytrium replicatum]|nr:hypothetical protein BJ742DRAFT_345481 [Cladochytrium replicatum]
MPGCHQLTSVEKIANECKSFSPTLHGITTAHISQQDVEGRGVVTPFCLFIRILHHNPKPTADRRLAAETENVKLGQGVELLSEKDLQLLKLAQELNQKLDAELEEGGENLLSLKAFHFIIPNEFGENFNYYGVHHLFAKYLTHNGRRNFRSQ